MGSYPNSTAFWFEFDFTLNSSYVEGTIPSITVQLLSPYGNIANISSAPLTFEIDSYNHHALIAFTVNSTAAVDVVNNAFAGDSFFLQLTGTENQNNILQKVLKYFHYNMMLNATQSANGSSQISGGVLPVVTITLGNSTVNTLDANVSLTVDLPLTFPIILGNLIVDVLYQNSIVATITDNDIVFTKGPNFVSVLVTLTALYNRVALEDLISNYLFGNPLFISLSGTFNGSNFYGPTTFIYDINLPASPGGPDTSVIKCVQMTQMTFSAIDFLLGNCNLQTLVEVFFHNPLPFSMSLLSLDFDVYFDNPNGVVYLGIQILAPAYNILFSHVVVK